MIFTDGYRLACDGRMDELDEMAERLGIEKNSHVFRGRSRYYTFDKRSLAKRAIRLGAVKFDSWNFDSTLDKPGCYTEAARKLAQEYELWLAIKAKQDWIEGLPEREERETTEEAADYWFKFAWGGRNRVGPTNWLQSTFCYGKTR